MSHAAALLATDDAILLPAAATCFAQAVEVRMDAVCGFDMSAASQHRWTPAFAAGKALLCLVKSGCM